jgi:hypothetical protein
MSDFEHLRQCAKPIVFETGVIEAPFSVAGTGFVVGFRDALFVLTARHVVSDWPKEGIAIIMSSEGERLPLRARWEIKIENEEEKDDSSDLIIFRADLAGISALTRRSNHLLHLTPPGVTEWFDDRFSSTFFLFGYPVAVNEADYENSRVIQNQCFIHGSFVGPSISFGCYELSVKNPLTFKTFDGFSGSPIFSLCTNNRGSTQPTFCGMALRGTVGSGSVHFLGSETIVAALEEVCNA